MTVGRDHIEPNSVDAELDEAFGADVADAPVLGFSRPHCKDRLYLSVNGKKVGFIAELCILNEQEALLQIGEDREQLLESIDDESAGPSAPNLLIDEAVSVRMVPEEPGTLAAVCGDMHLVVEMLARVDVNEDVVAIALRRHGHAVKVQVRRLVGELVLELNPQRVAEPASQQW